MRGVILCVNTMVSQRVRDRLLLSLFVAFAYAGVGLVALRRRHAGSYWRQYNLLGHPRAPATNTMIIDSWLVGYVKLSFLHKFDVMFYWQKHWLSGGIPLSCDHLQALDDALGDTFGDKCSLENHTGVADGAIVHTLGSMYDAAIALGLDNVFEGSGNGEVEQSEDSIPPGQPNPTTPAFSDSDDGGIVISSRRSRQQSRR